MGKWNSVPIWLGDKEQMLPSEHDGDQLRLMTGKKARTLHASHSQLHGLRVCACWQVDLTKPCKALSGSKTLGTAVLCVATSKPSLCDWAGRATTRSSPHCNKTLKWCRPNNLHPHCKKLNSLQKLKAEL